MTEKIEIRERTCWTCEHQVSNPCYECVVDDDGTPSHWSPLYDAATRLREERDAALRDSCNWKRVASNADAVREQTYRHALDERSKVDSLRDQLRDFAARAEKAEADAASLRCALHSALAEVARLKRGLEKIASCVIVSVSPPDCPQVAKNLLAGREWDGGEGK